jgi:hypothetical protein
MLIQPLSKETAADLEASVFLSSFLECLHHWVEHCVVREASQINMIVDPASGFLQISDDGQGILSVRQPLPSKTIWSLNSRNYTTFHSNVTMCRNPYPFVFRIFHD